MPSDRVKDTVKKKVLSRPLDEVRRYVEKTEFQLPEGVTMDALDLAEAKSLLQKSATKGLGLVGSKKPPTQTTPSRRPTVQLTKAQTTPSRRPTVQLTKAQSPNPKNTKQLLKGAGRGAAALKGVSRKIPPAAALIMAYEAASLGNSEEARDKAREQYRAMGERDYPIGDVKQLTINAGKNALQGLADPMGTLYGVGSAVGDISSTYARIAAQKLDRRPRRGIKR